jgi:hypothetical protein
LKPAQQGITLEKSPSEGEMTAKSNENVSGKADMLQTKQKQLMDSKLQVRNIEYLPHLQRKQLLQWKG